MVICLIGCASATNNTDISSNLDEIQSDNSVTHTSSNAIVSNGTSKSIKQATTTTSQSVATSSSKAVKTATNAKIATKTSVGSLTSNPGSTVTFKTTVKTTDNKNVNTGKVAYKINGNTIGTSSVSDGVSTFKYKIPASYTSAEYQITAKYGENDKYKESGDTSTLHLNNVTKTKTTVGSLTSYPGRKVTIKANVKTLNNNKAVNSGKVSFKINGKSIGTSKVSKGVATISYTIPTSFSSATYQISVIYGQNGEFKESSDTATLHLNNVTKTSIKIEANTIIAGETNKIKALIKSSKTVKNGKVSFKLNGKTIGTVTVSNGEAVLNYAAPGTLKGSYTLTAIYGQCGEFKESQTSIKIDAASSQYLKPSKNCEVGDDLFKKVVKEVTAECTTTYQKAKALFDYANRKLVYSGYYNTRYGAKGTLQREYGNCCDMAHVVVALMRTAGIQARYNHAKCYFTSGLVTGHVWAEVLVDGVWYKCDATSIRNSFGVIKNWYKCGTINKYASLPF